MKRISLSILVIGILLLSACGAPTEAPPTETEEYEEIMTPIDARELCEAYIEDKKAADTQYKGKIIHVTGIVRSILPPSFIYLESGYRGVQISLQAILSSGQEEQMAALKAGQEIKIRGLCAGLFQTNLTLRDCVIED